MPRLYLTDEGRLKDPDTNQELPYKSIRRTWTFPSHFSKDDYDSALHPMFNRCTGLCALCGTSLCLRAPCLRRENLQNRALCFISSSEPAPDELADPHPSPVLLVQAESPPRPRHVPPRPRVRSEDEDPNPL